MSYILEVLEFIPGKKLVHVGYMDKVFPTKEEAAEYYDKHNPHARGLNAHGKWRSDWDPETHLMYVVIELNIPPFDSK
jgi:hypothetical protein